MFNTLSWGVTKSVGSFTPLDHCTTVIQNYFKQIILKLWILCQILIKININIIVNRKPNVILMTSKTYEYHDTDNFSKKQFFS